MKVLVMAAGAVGGYFGSVLAEKNDVLLIARGEHLDRIRSSGLKVISATSGNFTSKAIASESPPQGYEPDLLLYCVKSYHNPSACDLIASAVGTNTTILTLQNGIGSGDYLNSRFGTDATLLGAAYIEASRPEPGIIEEHGGSCRISLGDQSGEITDRASKTNKILTESNIESRISNDIMSDLWQKMIFITALSGMTCITRAQFEKVLDNPITREIAISVMKETKDTALALGINLPPDIIQSTMSDFMKHKSELVSSMYQDLSNKRPLEIDTINGAVSKIAKKYRIPTPLNDFISACLSIAEVQG